MELPSAAELDATLNVEKMQDELPEGMVLSVMPPAREHLEDPLWYNQAGWDPLDVKKVFKIQPGPEQVVEIKSRLADILQEYAKYGPKVYEKAARLGRADVIGVLLDLGAELDIGKVKGETEANEGVEE